MNGFFMLFLIVIPTLKRFQGNRMLGKVLIICMQILTRDGRISPKRRDFHN